MNIPEGWKEVLLAEMERRFAVTKEKGRLHDDALPIDDTQIGVEFAIDFIESTLAAAPTPSRNTWRTNGDTCLNCGKRITQHEDQTFCPTPPAAMQAQDEPIYQVSLSGKTWTDTTKKGFDSWGSENKRRALYTRPDGLRKAAEEALEHLEEIESVSWGGPSEAAINLRAALEGK